MSIYQRIVQLALCSGVIGLLASPGQKANADERTTFTHHNQPRWKYFPSTPSAPEGAPNVLLIMTDDVGFAATSAFGGPVPTPTFESLAKAGLRYNAFCTTAMSSPTRAALLTGRNHHAVGTGSLTNVAVDMEGYTAVIPKSAGTIAQVLHQSGYDTAFFGKNHNTPEWETGPMGPFDRWPNGLGFDYFYGFNAAMTDQFSPQLVENRNPINPPTNDPGYHLDRDLSDHLIHWLEIQHNLDPGRPFFAYLAPGTVHSPHQAPANWIAKFHGQFDQGWDKLREEVFARQKQMGIIPEDAVLTPRPKELPAWDSLSPEMREFSARTMEVAAAQLAHCDYQIGRVIEWLRQSGQLDNTLVIYLQGDNGASLESYTGTNNDLMGLIGIEPSEEALVREMDAHGGPSTFGNYPAAWAWATNTPFQWGKQVASHLGGLRDGLVISWPKRIKQVGQIRSQFSHVIDIAPTIYEAAGITAPDSIDGHKQQPIDGVSMVYTFDNAGAPGLHHEQYFEMNGNRAFLKDGWMASTTPELMPWDHSGKKVDPATYAWELYNLGKDYSQSHNLASSDPAKLSEMQAGFDEAAKKYHVYPIMGDLLGRLGPGLRPDILEGRTHFTYCAGDTRYPTTSFPNINQHWSLIAHTELSSAKARGPIVVKGEQFGGMILMLDDAYPVFIYDPSGRPEERLVLRAATALTIGTHEIRIDTKPGSAPRSGILSMSVDGDIVASADAPILYRVHGDAYIGRPGLSAAPGGQPNTELSGAKVDAVEIVTDNGHTPTLKKRQ